MTQQEFDKRMDAHTNAICADYRALLESGVEYGSYDAGRMAHTLDCKFHVYGIKSSNEINKLGDEK